MKTFYIVLIGVTGLILFAGSIGFGWFGFPSMINRKIENKVTLRDNSEAFERWRLLPQAMTMNYYVFNVTNPDEVTNGSKPILREIGPFVFDQYMEKVKLVEHEEDDTISYNLKKTLFFNEEKTKPLNLDTEITIIDPTLMGIILRVKSEMEFALQFMEDVINDIMIGPESPFKTVKVRDIMTDGVPVINCSNPSIELSKMACLELPKNLPKTLSEIEANVFQFALMDGMNTTLADTYRISRGIHNSATLGEFVSINGHETLYDTKAREGIWASEYCNAINGTDGTIYSPFQPSSGGFLEIFIPELCRSIKAIYERKMTYKDISGQRYVMNRKMFQYPGDNNENVCYCPQKKKQPVCMKNGVMDITKCIGSPLAVSLPHFLDADDEFRNFVIGLSPNRTKHESYLEIEPKTGTPLRIRLKIQLCVNLTSAAEITILKRMPNGILPVYYFEMEFDLNEKNSNTLKGMLSLLSILNGVKWVSLVLSAAIIAGAMYLYGHRTYSASYESRVSPNGNINMAFEKDYPLKTSTHTITTHATNGHNTNMTPINGNDNGAAHFSKKDLSESSMD